MYLAGSQDPGPSLEANFFYNFVRDYSSDQNSQRTSDNGDAEEPQTDVVSRVIGIVVQLGVISPGKSSCEVLLMKCDYKFKMKDLRRTRMSYAGSQAKEQGRRLEKLPQIAPK